MSVVNVRVANLRQSGYQSLEQWMQSENNVYVGRHGRIFIHGDTEKKVFNYAASPWHNPYKVGVDGTIDDVLNKYYHYLIRLLADENQLNQFKMLKGKNLGCWCTPNKCHADVIIYVLNQL